MHLRSFSMRDLLHSLNALALLVLAAVMAGCGPGEDSAGAGLPPRPVECAPGEMPLEGGGCQPAGLPPGVTAGLPPDMPCPPGEMPLAGGGCQPAGVPPEACGQGFEPDGQGGCNSILPPAPCPPGQMAVPGETQCHEVAPCGTGDYGMIPVDATMQFVNAAYPGNDSDGTQAKPWKKIQHGINQAKVDRAIVAVAAGTYTEDLLIKSRPVRLWGRCPAMVEVVGTGAEIATLEISGWKASHSETHNLAITGPGAGILVVVSSNVVVAHVWVHDTDGRGIDEELASTTISGSLIEAANEVGVFVAGSEATIEASVVRATQSFSDGTAGIGIAIEDIAATQKRATLTLHTSLVERNHEYGVVIFGSDATIDATVVRATQPQSDGTGGVGIGIVGSPDAITVHEHATLTLRTSLVEQNHVVGVAVSGSDATIEATVVRATQPHVDGTDGGGIIVQRDPTTRERGTLKLRTSLLEQNHDFGAGVIGSDATIEATVVRTTQPENDGTFGYGIVIQSDPTGQERGEVMLRTSLVEQNYAIGINIIESDATIEATVVRGTQSLVDGWGRGIQIQGSPSTPNRATMTLRTSLVEENDEVGVFVINSAATIDATVVRTTRQAADELYGDGIVVISFFGYPTTANITSTKVEDNARAGILNASATVILGSSTVQCNRFDIDGEEAVQGQPFTFDGSKGNLCGCGENPDPFCTAVSADLSPPPPLSP